MSLPLLVLFFTCFCGEANASNLSHIRGVAGAGWLHLEDWMYSWPADGTLPPSDYEYDLVDTQRGSPQGRLFPSDLLRSHDFSAANNYSTIKPWASEGDLVTESIAQFGERAVIDAFVEHRTRYVTDEDLALMASHGVNVVRLNVGWWAFHTFPLPEAEAIVHDMCYANKSFVTLSRPFLDSLLDRFAKYNLQVLLDMHAMPCGSADGTYNGVFPQEPLFFSRGAAMSYGFDVINNMLQWFLALPDAHKAVIHGFTLMNEPGHLMIPTYLTNADEIISWLRQSVALYRQTLEGKVKEVPLLYMNMIDTAFNFQGCSNDRLQCMVRVVAVDCGLANTSWAVFDIHHYFAWDNGGGVQSCANDSALQSYVESGMQGYMSDIIKTASIDNLTSYATSEWSLCTHRNDSQACGAVHEQQVMYDGQTEAFTQNGFANFFWGWKMPYGGWHETKWSLKNYLTGGH